MAIQIRFENECAIEAQDLSLSLLDIALQNGIPHTHACGGRAQCSTCRVAIVDNPENCEPRNPAESALARRKGFADNIRLACQLRLRGSVAIRRLVIDDEDLIEAESAGASAGRQRKLAILFSDVRSFTTFTEKNLPYDVVHSMNRYFRRMGDAVKRNDGYIDKYIGDGLMALFGLEENDPRRVCLAAVQAGLDMLQRLEEVNEYLRRHIDHEFRIGIGLHFGEAIVGEIGHPDKREFTALGDNVNMASRIESATKKAGVSLLISEDLHREIAQDVVVARRFQGKLKGKSGDYRMLNVTGLSESGQKLAQDMERERLRRVEQARAAESATPRIAPVAPAIRLQSLKSFDLPLVDIQPIAEGAFAFRLDRRGSEFRFRAGQHVNLYLPGGEESRLFSIASGPSNADSLLFATRDRGSEYKRRLLALKPGVTLPVQAAEGGFTLPETPTDLVMIAGGIGITPLRSMLEELAAVRDPRKIRLLYFNRTRAQAPFLENLEAWRKDLPNFEILARFTREPDPQHVYSTGRLTEEFIREVGRELADPLYLIAGPDAMALDALALLERAGAPAERIKFEAFYGY